MAASAAARSSSRASTPRYSGALRMTPRQEEVAQSMGGPQRHMLLVGGSPSGKTALLCRLILVRAVAGEKFPARDLALSCQCSAQLDLARHLPESRSRDISRTRARG